MGFIELQNIVKTYRIGDTDVPILKGVSLSIERSEMVALMGSSGSGKSTLMNILGCLDRPTSGKYLLDGIEVGHLSRDDRASVRNQKIGFVFQSFNLLPRTSALENVCMPLTYRVPPLSRSAELMKGKELLTSVGLADRMDHEPSRLSGGQQQRVAIARSLVNDPIVLLADEPTGNLDTSMTREILEMFRVLNRGRGLTIILVTHEPEVAEYADRTIRLRDGAIENEFPARQLHEV